MYDTPEEARQKLESSVVLYNNEPVFITSTSGKKNAVLLTYTKLPASDGHVTKPIDDPLWDFKSIGTKLGYASIMNPHSEIWDSVFISRAPVRHSRQGLDQRTVVLSGFEKEASGAYQFTWNDIIYKKNGFAATIQNNFPTVLTAFNQITGNEEYKSIPIHRKISLFYDQISPPYLLYRNDKVGYTEDGIHFKLARHKGYLKEELTDMIGLKIA